MSAAESAGRDFEIRRPIATVEYGLVRAHALASLAGLVDRRALRAARGDQVFPPRVPRPARRAVVGPAAHEPHAGRLLRLPRQRRARVRVLRHPAPSSACRSRAAASVGSFSSSGTSASCCPDGHSSRPASCSRSSGRSFRLLVDAAVHPRRGVWRGAIPVADLPSAGRPAVHLELVPRRRIHLHGARVPDGQHRASLFTRDRRELRSADSGSTTRWGCTRRRWRSPPSTTSSPP